uniref:UBA domain-containing protein n=1 Tax=Cuerna arida TaxID=1464854 RepID=A0A1B6GU36_9HEMI
MWSLRELRRKPEANRSQQHPLIKVMRRFFFSRLFPSDAASVDENLLNSPLFQGFFSNPERVRELILSNPQVRSIMDRLPEIGLVLNNPEMFREVLEITRNPAMMQEVMRTQDRAMSNLESIPGGYNALQRIYRDIQEPMMEAVTNPFSEFQSQSSSSSSSATNPQQGTENREPLPNPWEPANRTVPTVPTSFLEAGLRLMQGNQRGNSDSGGNAGGNSGGNSGRNTGDNTNQSADSNTINAAAAALGFDSGELIQGMEQFSAGLDMFSDYLGPDNEVIRGLREVLDQASSGITEGLSGFSGAGNAATPPPPAPTSATQTVSVNYEQLYREQLAKLTEMGFTNGAANLQALMDTNGNINAAIERLLNLNSLNLG